MDQDSYCREIEAYLCRKNEGHLVRIVGPAFNMVTSWATRGVPFKVACRGIDRYVERYYAKGPRRRPVRVEFCEADVLDVYDEWRKAVGVGMAGMGDAAGTAAPQNATTGGTPAPLGSTTGATPPLPAPHHSLRAHLDRIVTRLTDVQTAAGVPPALEAVIGRLIEQLGGEREGSRGLRGEARQAYIDLLARRDAELMEAVRGMTPPEQLARLRDEAAEDLAAFRGRMSHEAYAHVLDAATDKALREQLKLPTISYT